MRLTIHFWTICSFRWASHSSHFSQWVIFGMCTDRKSMRSITSCTICCLSAFSRRLRLAQSVRPMSCSPDKGTPGHRLYRPYRGCTAYAVGYFLKAVVADRLATFVDPVYADYMNFSGVTCFIASVFYSLQIYGDFAGYSLIAIGVGRLFGFDLINNFRRPYLSQSITEFWKKWHISLTRWLTDYVYIPLVVTVKASHAHTPTLWPHSWSAAFGMEPI